MMNENQWRIVADSSSDVLSLTHVPFAAAPLKIMTTEREYVDDPALDVAGMVADLQSYRGRSTTSCPNPEDWLAAYGDAENIFCVTITATLSGSYNAACLAKTMYEEAHPGRRVHVINSLSAGPEVRLIIERLQSLILGGMCFDGICREIDGYMQGTGLLFVLESMKNLANNGRVSPLVASIAGVIGIRVVGRASERGDLEAMDKCRGELRALDTVVRHMKEMGWRHGKVRIAHCLHIEAARKLRDRLRAESPRAQIEIYSCRGLCSFYAERGGMLIGFEKN